MSEPLQADTGDPAEKPGPDGRETPPGWRPVARLRTYELVLDRIEEQILAGQLHVGDRLPGERDLAGMLGVSRSAVREAMRTLEAQGVVQSTVGTGPDSGTIVASQSSKALTRLLRLHVGLANFPLADLVETRVMLERGSVRLAGQRISQQDLDGLGALLEQMEDSTVARNDFNELDTAFHVAIAAAGGNALIRDVTSAIRESLRHILLDAFIGLDNWDEVADTLRSDHRRVLELISKGDGAAAADEVERHIRGFYAVMTD